jgi:hypothetical protein
MRTPEAIPIGHSGGEPVFLTPEVRSRHLHVVGGSGTGKSYFLEHCVRRDILAGHGVCVIDPHGELFERLVDWCAVKRVDTFTQVHLIDPSLPEWRVAFNPLRLRAGERTVDRVDAVMGAIAAVWGGEDSRATPLIRTCMRAILSVLTEHQFSLLEADRLIDVTDRDGVRTFLTSNIQNPAIFEVWQRFNALAEVSQRDFLDQFASTTRRLLDLLYDDIIREIIGQVERRLDFARIMDKSEVVLVNLAPKAIEFERGRMLGTLITNELFHIGQKRNVRRAKERPFYLYIDECYRYLTDDIERMLDESRKRGLHVSLAHQRLAQLAKDSPTIYSAVMAIQNKVVFGGLQDEDAKIVVHEILRPEFDLERPKRSLDRQAPTGRFNIQWLEGWSRSTSEGDSDSEGQAEGVSLGAGTMSGVGGGLSQFYDADGNPIGGYSAMQSTSGGLSQFSGTSSASVRTRGSSQTSSETESAHQALVPEYGTVIGGLHSFEEITHLAIVRLREQQNRNAIVKSRGLPSFDIATIDVHDPCATTTERTRFIDRAMRRSAELGYVASRADAAAEIAQRSAAIKARAGQAQPAAADDDEEFRGG